MALGLLRRRGETMTADDVGGKMAELRGEIATHEATIARLERERDEAQALLDEHRVAERLQEGDRSGDIEAIRVKIDGLAEQVGKERAEIGVLRRVLDGMERPLLEAEHIVAMDRFRMATERGRTVRSEAIGAVRANIIAARQWRTAQRERQSAAGDVNRLARLLGKPEVSSGRAQLLPAGIARLSAATLTALEKQPRVYDEALEAFDREVARWGDDG